jgi:hypothetical protein
MIDRSPTAPVIPTSSPTRSLISRRLIRSRLILRSKKMVSKKMRLSGSQDIQVIIRS